MVSLKGKSEVAPTRVSELALSRKTGNLLENRVKLLANINVRKALADVSNVQENSTANIRRDGSRIKVSTGSSTKIVGVSLRKSFTGRVERKSDVQLDASKKGTDSRAYLGHQKNDTDVAQSVVATKDRFVRKHVLATRKSLPVPRRVSRADISSTKENDRNSETAKGQSGLPSKKLVQTNALHISSRKSIKPLIRTSLKASTTQRTLKSTSISGQKKSQSTAAMSAHDELTASSSLPGNGSVHFKFDLTPETLYLTVTLVDQYLSQVSINKSDMQLVGLTALLLASKYEDFWHPRVKDLISISAQSYTRDQMLGMEKLILRKLKFRLNTPTPYVFMVRFLKAAQSDKKLEHMAFFLIDLCLVEYEALAFKPSLLCASALYVARCTIQITPPWTPLLHKHARYGVLQIRHLDCAEMILKFHKAAGLGKLAVTHEKYSRPELSGVAAVKPLDKLPL
ncbi:unnamed protein product [Lupinus luteus]|uniref:B-like cyclin n=1 Tax=Lupinus luteus TaxID=3873 RepID=A0AAV1YJT2_LUPLU